MPKSFVLYFLTIVLLFTTTVLECSPSIVIGESGNSIKLREGGNGNIDCMNEINDLPGRTYPCGKIILQESETQEILCKLNLTHPIVQGYNGSHLHFIFSDNLSGQVEKSVLNETTAVVRVKHMSASNNLLKCVLRIANGNYIEISQNLIEVGYPPLPVENFRCVARDWRSLNCTWKLPWNPIPTHYTVSYLRYSHDRVFCPKRSATPTGCVFTQRSFLYRPNADPIYVRLHGINALNSSGVVWNYKFRLAEIVIPEKPRIHSIMKISPFSYRLNWTFENFEYFKPGLDHRLSICHFGDEGEEICNFTMFSTRIPRKEIKMVPYFVKIFTLPYAFTNYTVKVNLRAPEAKGEEWWSPTNSVRIITDSRAPEYPPEGNMTGYESVPENGGDLRQIELYWKSVPKYLQNGPEFNYTIEVYENEIKLPMNPDELTESYSKFSNMKMTSSYTFRIFAVNSIGKSENFTDIIVPSVYKCSSNCVWVWVTYVLVVTLAIVVLIYLLFRGFSCRKTKKSRRRNQQDRFIADGSLLKKTPKITENVIS